MQGCREIFEAEGQAQELSGNNPLLLIDPDSVWLVTAGHIDVFVVPFEEGRPAGGRVHLFRVDTDCLLCGSRPAAHALLAVGVPGSAVRRLPRTRLCDAAVDPASCAALLDGWLLGLTAGIIRNPAPRQMTLLEPGRPARLESGGAVRAARGAVWVNAAAGCRFLDMTDVPPGEGDHRFPVCGRGWLLVTTQTTLTGAPTEVLLGEPSLWTDLEQFHQAILACAALNAQEAAARARGRLRLRADCDRQMVRDTLSRLAAVADPADWHGPTPEREADPLAAACRLAAGRMGIEVQAPAASEEKRGRGDPVHAIARASRFRARRVLLAGKWWREDNGPLVGFWAEDRRPVALLPTSATSYELADPTRQTREPLTAAKAASLAAFAYCFYRPFPPRPVSVWGLLRFALAGGRRDLWYVAVLGLAGALLGLAVPVATGWLFDRVIPAADKGGLLLMIGALIAAALAAALFRLTQGLATLRLESRMDGGVQAAVWDRLLGLPVPFFRQYTAGDLAARAMGIGAIRQILTAAALSSLLASGFTVLYLVLLFCYDARLAGLAVVLFVVVLLVTCWSAVRELGYQKDIYRLRGKISGFVLQLITGLPRLRTAGAEDRALAVWATDFSAQRRAAYRARSVANGLATFHAAMPTVTAMALFAAVGLITAEGLSLGAFLAFIVAFVQVFFAAAAIGSSLSAVVEIVPLYQRSKPILHAVPEVDPTKSSPGDLSGMIEISHVSFQYEPKGPSILRDISLQVRPGEFVAFVGPSGAGKSTIVRLLLGFEPPTAGSIYYDGKDLAGLDLQAVRRQIGTVLQNSRVISGSIFNNIIGSSLLTLDEAWEAARLSGLDEDIRQMPMGMHTVVSEAGSTLSGGQRQRLLIARAVVKRPRILLFDEATSALDNHTQAIVSRSLEGLKTTRIVVAHRLSTVLHADRIYVLDGGSIVQSGTYEELVRQQGLFAELVKRQLV